MNRFEGILERVTELPFSPVASKILAVAQDERIGAHEIAKIVGQDQAFTARLLRIANSPYYGQCREVTTLSQAVNLLGINTIISLALSLSAFGSFPHEKGDGLNIEKLWEHSLGCAIWGKQIAMRVAPPSSEEVFIAGLLHDMGKTILYRFFRKEYLEAVKRAEAEAISLSESEQRVLGMNHVTIGELLARKWNLPQLLTYTIGFHHRPLSLPEDLNPSERRTVAIVHVADFLCEAFELGYGGERMLAEVDEGVWSLVGLGEETCRGLLEPVLDEFEKTGEIFSVALGWKRVDPAEAGGAGERRWIKEKGSPEKEERGARGSLPKQEEGVASFSRFIEAGKQIGLLAGLDGLLPNVASHARALLRADAAEILVPRGECMEVVGAEGVENLMGKAIPAQGSLVGWVARVGEAMVVPDIDEASVSWEREFFSSSGFRSHLFLPVEWAGQRIAVISVHSRRPRRWRSQEVAFFGAFVGLVAVAMENARLYQESEEKAATLKNLNVELERALHLKTRFLATVSHELRTPLVAIMGYCDLIVKDAYGEPSDKIKKVLGKVTQSANDLLAMIVNVLDLSQMESGSLTVHPRRVELKALLEEVSEKAAALLSGRPVVMQCDYDLPLPPLVTDGERLKQILSQLVDNAAKFTHEGKILLRARVVEGGVEIAVQDSGIGIDPQQQKIIFDGFRQVDDTDTRRYGGLGVGLHIVRRLLALLGGKITVESRPGEGSTFRIWLPSAENRAVFACYQ